jgi:hypothetical protein
MICTYGLKAFGGGHYSWSTCYFCFFVGSELKLHTCSMQLHSSADSEVQEEPVIKKTGKFELVCSVTST